MRTETENLELQTSLEKITPQGKIVSKNTHWVGRVFTALQYFLNLIISLFPNQSRQSWEEVRDRTAMTIAGLLLVPDSWSFNSVQGVVYHEGRHIQQMKWMGFNIHPIIGLPLTIIVYALLLFPIGIAFGRALMELDAESTALSKKVKDENINVAGAEYLMSFFAEKRVASRTYLYALPKSWSLTLGLWLLKRKLK